MLKIIRKNSPCISRPTLVLGRVSILSETSQASICFPLSNRAVGTKKHFLWYLSGAESCVQHASLAHYRLVGRDTNSTPFDSLCYIHRLGHVKQLWSHSALPKKKHTHTRVHTCRCPDNWLAFSNSFLWPPSPTPVIMERKGKREEECKERRRWRRLLSHWISCLGHGHQPDYPCRG